MTATLDRLSGHRSEPGWYEKHLSADGSRFAVFTGDKLLLQDQSVKWHGWDELPEQMQGLQPVFLGQSEDGINYFAVQAADAEMALPEGVVADTLRATAIAGMVGDDELSMTAQARSLLHWHANHLFCSQCGAATHPADGGYKRVCDNCGAEHFPRTDPVAIIAVVRGEKMLMGRSARFNEKMYSTLAGFVEPGETAEEAARREVFEESAIRVGDVRYMLSQPWPFPTNLMIGMVGEATSEEIEIDPDELEDARWFSFDEVRAMQRNEHPDGLLLPPDISIAYHLIVRVLDDTPYASG